MMTMLMMIMMVHNQERWREAECKIWRLQRSRFGLAARTFTCTLFAVNYKMVCAHRANPMSFDLEMYYVYMDILVKCTQIYNNNKQRQRCESMNPKEDWLPNGLYRVRERANNKCWLCRVIGLQSNMVVNICRQEVMCLSQFTQFVGAT